MAVTTLKNLVLKTASVSVKLTTPADRIGSGFPAVIDNPATFLSQGQLLPQLPEPEAQARSRREVADMREMSMPPTGMPAGPVGSFSGTTVRWCSAQAERANWASYPGSPTSASRLDRDCQSHERTKDARDRDAKPHAVWHRTATPIAATAK